MLFINGAMNIMFYDNLILSGTKINDKSKFQYPVFYDNLILSGTKMHFRIQKLLTLFYDNLILSGTKIEPPDTFP